MSHTSRDKAREVKPVVDKTQALSAPPSGLVRAGDDKSFEKAETFRRQTQSYSGSSLVEQQAIAAYESVEKDQQRQNIQMLLGVDTFV